MSAGPVTDHAARLAAAVAWLDQPGWGEEIARLTGAPPPNPAGAGPPTFGELALTGLGLVEGLAAEGRWAEAAAHGRRLMAFFAGPGAHLGPVAEHAFDGLRAACLARDPEELEDFASLVREVFS